MTKNTRPPTGKPNMPPKRIVILGAGVSGLTSALLLSQSHPSSTITILAKHMPGDYDIEYCSPWAGADYGPMNPPQSHARQYEAQSWREFENLASNAPEAGVHFQRTAEYLRATDIPPDKSVEEALEENEWLRGVVPEFRRLRQDELPPDIIAGVSYQSVCINVPIYLSWLVSRCLGHGVTFHRKMLASLSDCLAYDPDVVVNCTGLGSLVLGEVEDANLYPVRGQIVLVRNGSNDLMRSASAGPEYGTDESMYVMTRAAGGGTVLGGCRQVDKWDSLPDPNLAVRIMERAVRMCPDLVGRGQGIEGLDVIRHAVGLRPERKGRVRVELERGVLGSGKVSVVHNYGHGGYGYQSSYGCAQEVVRLVMQGLEFGTASRL